MVVFFLFFILCYNICNTYDVSASYITVAISPEILMKSIILTSLLVLSLVFTPQFVHARFFDPNDILTDQELFDGNALSITAIQRFLDSKNSVLKDYVEKVNGVPKLVSEMIYEIGKNSGISQKFLLAKLQHEQGLIEKRTATENALNWSTGYSCFNNRCNEKYKGMYAQLDAAATVQKIYAERAKSSGYFGFEIGRTSKTSDGKMVTPKNQATANLYIYTPYQGGYTGVGGNFWFWRVWNQYFTERDYPDGAVLRDSITGTYWRIEENKRRQFASEDVFLSDYKPTDAITVTPEQLAYYQVGETITLGNNVVVRGDSSGNTYFISNNKKFRVVGTQALALLGYTLASTNLSTPILIGESVLDSFPEGEPITEQSQYPQGILLSAPGGAIYFVQNGIKHPLIDEAVWQENFDREPPISVNQATVNAFSTGDPIKLNDGSIVKNSDGTYYLISAGKRKRFTSPAIVSRLYGIDAVTTAPQASETLLALHEAGDAIDYIDDTIQDPANYVSYAARVGTTNTTTTAEPTFNPYFALFDMETIPESMEAGETTNVTIRFRNRGDATWEAGKVYLKLIDENHPTSSFIEENRIPLQETAGYNRLATFVVPLKAPAEPGTIVEWFNLEYQTATGEIYEMPGGLLRTEITVLSDTTASVESTTIPETLIAGSYPKQVSVTLKNTGKTTWTGRRAALMITDEKGNKSPFYDANDWLDTSIVGVPVNNTYVSPGETATIRFTLNPRIVGKGTYTLVFNMELKDTEEPVYLDNGATWSTTVVVE